LTLLDVVIFGLQLYTPSATLMNLELGISTVFVVELCLRFYANDQEELFCASNVIDSLVVVVSFALSLVEISTPLLAARSARLIRFARASSRCGRNARASSRAGVEMRNFFSDARRSGAARARRIARASDEDVVPLFADVAAAKELAAVLEQRPWNQSVRMPPLASAQQPVLAAAKTLKRAVRAELENADALDVRFRASAKKKRPSSSVKKHVEATDDDDSSRVLVVSSSDDDDDDGDEETPKTTTRRVVTSVKGLVGIMDHALATAAANGDPPPRLLDAISGVGLRFLNRDI